jgi:plastocyanin
MRRRHGPVAAAALGLGLAVALGAAPAAVSQHGGSGGEAGAGTTTPVSIGFGAVSPPHLDVLVGDTVHWTNDSVRTHTVTADDGSFDSGRVVPTATYDRAFTAVGDTAYHCVIHPFIRGDVRASRVLLAAPAQPAASTRPFPLSGRAALPNGSAVTIEADRGAGFVPVATPTVQADRTFVASVVPGQTATYRAVSGPDSSAPVTLLVLDRRVAVRTARERHRLVIRASVTPASAGATVVLQLFLHEHFGWWPVQQAKLDRASGARFALRLRRRVAARVVLTLPDGATPLAISRTTRFGPTR